MKRLKHSSSTTTTGAIMKDSVMSRPMMSIQADTPEILQRRKETKDRTLQARRDYNRAVRE